MLALPSMTTSLLGALGRFVLVGGLLFAAGCSSSTSVAIPHPKPAATGLVATPTTVSMGPSDTTSIAASESGYSGAYSAQSSNTGVASVTPNGPAQFIVAGVAPGTCSVTISDIKGNSVTVQVSIQTVVIGGQ